LTVLLLALPNLSSAAMPAYDPGVTPGFYPGLQTPSGGGISVSGAPPVVPAYNSLPNAPSTLYLNFGGIDYPGSWAGMTPGNVPAYNTDSDPTTFSASELANIQQIWGRVAEAYSPFNLNVTTVAPGSVPVGGRWSQMVIAAENASGQDWYGVAGGVAFVGGFFSGGQQNGTGWAFTNYLGNGSAKPTADAATHEGGHQFGLDHQREFDPNGNFVSEYRGSKDGGLTAPIMGVSYYSIRGLWSNGTSASATSHQNDLAILTSGLGYRPDVENHDFAHARPLSANNDGILTASGVIKDMSEKDLYYFYTGSGNVSINVAHNSYGGMLDTKLQIYAEDGTLLQTIDPALSLTGPDYGLDAAFTGYLDAGAYYVGIAGHGDYGDVGQYSLTGHANPMVPEPSAIVMLGTAFACLFAYARRGKRKA
jgi:hypothetical protein